MITDSHRNFHIDTKSNLEQLLALTHFLVSLPFSPKMSQKNYNFDKFSHCHKNLYRDTNSNLEQMLGLTHFLLECYFPQKCQKYFSNFAKFSIFFIIDQ